MPTITDITPQKRDGVYNIFADDEFVCGLDGLTLSNLDIRVGQEISSQRLDEIKHQAEFGKAYSRGLYYLSFRPRSEREVRTYLAQKDFSPAIVDKVVAKLMTIGMVDDQEFARSWVASRRATKPRSSRQLHTELMQKGISRETIDSVLAEESDGTELDALRQLIVKKQKLPRYNNNGDKSDKQKLQAYLISQGFKYDDIKLAMAEPD